VQESGGLVKTQLQQTEEQLQQTEEALKNKDAQMTATIQVSVYPSSPTATHCDILHHTATHCNTLQHTATLCNTLQHTEEALENTDVQMTATIQVSDYPSLPTATHCNTHCNALQHSFGHGRIHCK